MYGEWQHDSQCYWRLQVLDFIMWNILFYDCVVVGDFGDEDLVWPSSPLFSWSQLSMIYLWLRYLGHDHTHVNV